jgi:hypothetical protein
VLIYIAVESHLWKIRLNFFYKPKFGKDIQVSIDCPQAYMRQFFPDILIDLVSRGMMTGFSDFFKNHLPLPGQAIEFV